jgi:hypothetical protein
LIRHRGPRIGIAVAILLVSVSVANAYLYSQSSTSITWESGTGWSNSAGGPHSPGSSDIVYIGNGAVVSVQGTDAGSALTVGTSGVNGAGVGTLNINSGSLAIGSTVNIGTASNSGTINDAATLTATTATNVNLGTLKVTGSLTSPTTTIASGGSLTGTGTVTSAVTENAGAYIGPGSSISNIGLLHLVGNVVMNGEYNWKLGDLTNPGIAGTDWDQIQMATTGNSTLSGSPTLNLTFLDSTAPASGSYWNASHQWKVIDNPGSGTTSFSAVTITGYGTGGVGALGTFSVAVGGDGNDVMLNWAPVPEPATLLLLATGLLGMVAYGWRKRK